MTSQFRQQSDFSPGQDLLDNGERMEANRALLQFPEFHGKMALVLLPLCLKTGSRLLTYMWGAGKEVGRLSIQNTTAQQLLCIYHLFSTRICKY